MSNHSFAPKLSENEEIELAGFLHADFKQSWLTGTVMQLWARGLLVRKQDHLLNGTDRGLFRQSRRGLLMLQRSQHQRHVGNVKAEFKGVAYRDLPV